MIVRDRTDRVDDRSIKGAVEEFMRQVRPRLDGLHAAYSGKGKISRRERTKGLPNNRLVHTYPHYITTMAAGYLVGSPVQYSALDEGALSGISQAYHACDMDSVDAELAVQASIYGRGVCICYADIQGMPKAATLDPRQAFVVYDDTVEHQPIFGVYGYSTYDSVGQVDGMRYHVYTDSEEICLQGAYMGVAGDLRETSRAAHYFGGVPIVEFWNSADERGDFEGVISLIDAYDALESDRINDKQQFTDAILLLTGCTVENDDPNDTRSPAQKLLEERTLALPDADAKADWLVKQSDEAGTEILRNAIKADIHKMSFVPDLSDENFAANASGVAMRYKLFGLEQLTKGKERWFRQGLRERLARFCHFLTIKGARAVDTRDISILFTRSLPVNETEIAQMVAALQGIVPDELLLAQLPFVDDAQDALDSMRAQKDDEVKRQQAMFGGEYNDANHAYDGEGDDMP